MLIHVLRKNETLDDLSQLYSVSKELIIRVNRLSFNNDIKEGEKIVIPIEDFYYFKRKDETLEYIEKCFNVSKNDIYKNNKTPLCFKDGSIRIKIKTIKKMMNVYSLLDLNLKSNAFIEADLESNYINNIVGYNVVKNNGKDIYTEDYYLKKVHDILSVNTEFIIDKNEFENYNSFFDYIKNNVLFNVYYSKVVLYYNSFNIDLELYFDKIKDTNIKTDIFMYYDAFKQVIKNYRLKETINKNIDKIFILPGFVNDSRSILKEEYFLFLNDIAVFDKDKLVIGYNLNNAENEDILEIIEKVKYLYDMGFSNIILYSCGNRFFKMEYILKHFFHISV